MNSIVGPIFNKKNCWKVEYVGSWTVHLCTVHSWIGHIMRLQKKKKKKKETENAEAGKHSAQTGTKAHRPSQLYLQLFILLYFSSPTIFHFLPIFNLFSSVFSHPHTSTVLDIYTTHFWVLSHLLWDLHVKTDTLSYLFMTFIFLFIFLLSHATYLSFPLKSFLSSVFSSLSLSLSLSDGYPDMLSMIAFNMDAQLFCLCSQNAGKHQWKHIFP